MTPELDAPQPVALPARSRITRHYPSTHLADAYAINLPAAASTDPEVLARFIFSQQAPWARALLKIRDLLVMSFGLKTARQLALLERSASHSRVGIFRIYSSDPTEIVLGEDDKHLDFRISVLCREKPTSGLLYAGSHQLVVSTVVHCHNLLGRAYILLIAPFHRLIVQSSIRRAARAGWPRG